MDECSICFESLQTPLIDIATTSCQHRFHISCLLQWFEQSSHTFRCPLCNQTNIDIETIQSTSPISSPTRLTPSPTRLTPSPIRSTPSPSMSNKIETYPSTFIEVTKHVEINSQSYNRTIQNNRSIRESKYRHDIVNNEECCCIIL